MKILALICFCLSFIYIGAQETTDKNDKLLQASSQLNTEYLINASDVETGLWIMPHIYNQVKWIKTGKQIEVEEPIYEIDGYEDAWAWVNKPTTADPYNKVYEKYKRPIYKKTGSKKVIRNEEIPSKENSSISYCQRKYIEAMNGLCAYTVLQMGAQETISIKMTKYYEWQDFLRPYGLSDNTVELSMQILMFMKSKYPNHASLAMEGLHKLLDGQIENGPGKGLWGYYSVNWEFHANVDNQIKAIEAKIALLKVPVIKDGEKVTPDIEQKIIMKRELESAINSLNIYKLKFSREFYQGRNWFEIRKIEVMNQAFPTFIMWPPSEYDPKEKRIGCLLSTQVALYAINEAQKLGFLSEDSLKKYKEKAIIKYPKSKSFIQFDNFPNIKTNLTNALSYFQRTQDKSGGWLKLEEECKPTFHPFPDMLKNKKPFPESSYQKSVKKHEVKKILSSDCATVSAMHSLSLIAQLQGKDEFKTRNDKMIAAGLSEYNKIIEKALNDLKIKEWDPITLYPYDFFMSLPDVQKSFGGSILEKTEGKQKIISFLITLQNESGSFSKEHDLIYNHPWMPHPFFPNIIQDLWVEKKYLDGFWEHPKVNTQLIASCLALLTLQNIEPEKVKYDAKWTNAIEAFTNLRLELLGIRSDILAKPAIEEPKKEDGTKRPEEGTEKK